jgi:hypothetical protein
MAAMMALLRRDDAVTRFDNMVNPEVEVNAGLWTLFAATTVLLGMRLWSKIARRSMWWDDYILIVCWVSESSGRESGRAVGVVSRGDETGRAVFAD